ncbi:MAG: hypothetical protein JOS17DRAFT_732031, partial [Linnemannia elongata]
MIFGEGVDEMALFLFVYFAFLQYSTAISRMPPSDIFPGRVDKPIDMNSERKALTSFCSRSMLGKRTESGSTLACSFRACTSIPIYDKKIDETKCH